MIGHRSRQRQVGVGATKLVTARAVTKAPAGDSGSGDVASTTRVGTRTAGLARCPVVVNNSSIRTASIPIDCSGRRVYEEHATGRCYFFCPIHRGLGCSTCTRPRPSRRHRQAAPLHGNEQQTPRMVLNSDHGRLLDGHATRNDGRGVNDGAEVVADARADDEPATRDNGRGGAGRTGATCLRHCVHRDASAPWVPLGRQGYTAAPIPEHRSPPANNQVQASSTSCGGPSRSDNTCHPHYRSRHCREHSAQRAASERAL